MPSPLLRVIACQFWHGRMSHQIYVVAIYFDVIYLMFAIERPASADVKPYVITSEQHCL